MAPPPPMRRYLIYFSYIGTQFHGVQRQAPRGTGTIRHDATTVQGILELAISRMKPLNEVKLMPSSRTDQGVHGLKNTACVDLQFPCEMEPYNIHSFVNKFFLDTELEVRVLDIVRVSKDFIGRKAPLWRKYVYRFATLKHDAALPQHLTRSNTLPIPMTEFNRCYFILNSHFDTDKVNTVCDHFIGTKDFISFMAKPALAAEDLVTTRRIHRLHIEPSVPYFPAPYAECYNYWHLICEGKSFLYKQVRRTLSILLAVGQNKISEDYVKSMIEDPSPEKWPSSVVTVPAHGLYLADIFYDPVDLELSEQEQKEDELWQAEVAKERAEKLALEELTVDEKKERIRKHIGEMQEKRETAETVVT